MLAKDKQSTDLTKLVEHLTKKNTDKMNEIDSLKDQLNSLDKDGPQTNHGLEEVEQRL